MFFFSDTWIFGDMYKFLPLIKFELEKIHSYSIND